MKFLFASALALTAFSASAVSLVGLTSDNRLVTFDSATPGTTTASVGITGLASATDRLVGIDLRGSNQTIYGVSLSDSLYSISLATGAATRIGTTGLGIDIVAGVGYGVDTNPVSDALRVVGSNGANYAVNFTTGVAAVQTSIAAGFTGAAYTPTNPTSLYYLNTNTDSIWVATSGFDNPMMTNVGNLGVDALRANGFEIAGDGTAYAALNVDGGSLVTGIYTIALSGPTAGSATLLGEYKDTLSGLTIAPVPEPGTYALMALGLAAVGAAARRRRS